MAAELVTVGTYSSPIDANLDRARLEDAGIGAVLADEEAAVMNWALTNAMGGIKLLVPGTDVEAATAILAAPAEPFDPAEAMQAFREPDDLEPETARVSEQPDVPESAASRREELADRALKAAVLGWLFLPAQLYAFWLLLRVFVSNEPLGPRARRRAWTAALFNLPAILGLCLFLKYLLAVTD
ncbi:MAG: putative signal transducing protein [Gemmataceae bacterium]